MKIHGINFNNFKNTSINKTSFSKKIEISNPPFEAGKDTVLKESKEIRANIDKLFLEANTFYNYANGIQQEGERIAGKFQEKLDMYREIESLVGNSKSASVRLADGKKALVDTIENLDKSKNHTVVRIVNAEGNIIEKGEFNKTGNGRKNGKITEYKSGDTTNEYNFTMADEKLTSYYHGVKLINDVIFANIGITYDENGQVESYMQDGVITGIRKGDCRSCFNFKNGNLTSYVEKRHTVDGQKKVRRLIEFNEPYSIKKYHATKIENKHLFRNTESQIMVDVSGNKVAYRKIEVEPYDSSKTETIFNFDGYKLKHYQKGTMAQNSNHLKSFTSYDFE